jgi:ribosomal-protein-alanine N-acetyltransferase
MKLAESIETSRLRLRKPSLSDAEAIFKDYAQDEEVVRYLVWRTHRDIAETRAFLERCVQCWEGTSSFPYAIERKEDGRLLGMIEAMLAPHSAGAGYVLARAHWGKGYMPEALTALNSLVLAQPGIFRMAILCDVDNLASARVMEKVGMQREGLLRRRSIHPAISPEPRDCYLYSLVR